jgi:hypothetical protein
MASPAAGSPKKFNWLLVIVPVLVLGLVGIGVAWEMFRAKMEAMQQGQGGEARLGVSGGPTGPGERRSREVKVGTTPVAAPAPEEDEVTVLGKKKKPPPPKPAPALTPVDRAWRSVKADYDKLEARNETSAKKYRMRMMKLEDQRSAPSEASFVKEAGALEEQLRDELAKPENQ